MSTMKKESPSVAVIMATYNGERYIRDQLQSIVEQDYPNLTLIIRDDGSTDRTLDIIQEYVSKYPWIMLIPGCKNLNVPESFYIILRKCGEYDYYAFADQDDIWIPQKISRAVEALESISGGGPLLYYSAFDYVDTNKSFIRESPRQPERLDLNHVLYYTPGLGFTLVFNKSLKELALPSAEKEPDDYGELHDRRFMRTAVVFGRVYYDNFVTAHHIRQISSVTSADKTNTSLLRGWIKNELKGKEALLEKQGLKKFVHDYQEVLPERNKKVLNLFVSDGKRIKKFFYPHRLRTRILGEIAIRILFLSGKI